MNENCSPLTQRQELVNGLCFGIIASIFYLAAPVIYVDVVHAALCDRLGASKTVANLPTTMGAVFGIIPLFVVWRFSYTRLLKPVLATVYLVGAVACLIVPFALLSGAPPGLAIAATVLQGGITRAVSGISAPFLWETFVRGTSEGVRGKTLSITYGIGPLFAVASSLFGVQWMMNSELPFLQYPYNFSFLFLAASLLMFAIAFVASRFHVSMVQAVTTREPIDTFLLGGFKTFFTSRILLTLVVIYFLVQAGFYAANNASLNVREVLGVEPEKMSGLINALRFGAKAIAGVILGLLLARYGARAPLLGAGGFILAASIWTVLAGGYAYLLAFGLFGAGELYGLYGPHYVAVSSRHDRMKRNLAIFGLLGVFGLLTALVHGFVADMFGMGASMGLAIGAAAGAVALVVALPARPAAKE